VTGRLADQNNSLRRSVQDLLASCNLIRELVDLATQEGHQLFLVGGFIRDCLLGRRSKDADLVTIRASDLAKSLANKIGIKPVIIDRKFGTIRLLPAVVSASSLGESCNVDLSPLRGSSIEEDLGQRDFTVNALAVDLSAWHTSDSFELINPIDGLSDLNGGQLRACSHRSFTDDALRVLRAYRLVSTHGFTIESETKGWILRARQDLDEVAVERIRDELALILSSSNSASIFRMLDKDKILAMFLPECESMRDFPQNDFHHQDVLQHSFSALEALETFLERPEDLLKSFADHSSAILAQTIAAERTRQSMLKLAVIIHDIGKPLCKTLDQDGVIHFYGHEVVGAKLAGTLCSRLRFSNKEVHFVSQLVRQHMRAVHLFNLERPSRRALGRFFGLGPELFWPLLLLYASDYRATKGPRSSDGDMRILRQRLYSCLDFYYEQLEPKETEPRLVNGSDLINYLHLSPGPTVGKLLQKLTELQWEGLIRSREEALQKAAQLLRDWGRDNK
jgi:tRNA nucleotidyltransferase/poly(A) polymerase